MADDAELGAAFLRLLIDGVPELETEWQDHLAFYDGPLPHVFMADVERWAEGRLATGGETDAVLDEVLDRIEVGFSLGPEAVRNMIAVSFLEHLPPAGSRAAGLRHVLGPTLREHVLRYEL